MDNLFLSQIYTLYYFSASVNDEEVQVLEGIKKCTETLNKSGIEQTALFRAWGAKNNLNLEKFRQEVKNELAAEAKKGKKGDSLF